jgi:hypothetical protein
LVPLDAESEEKLEEFPAGSILKAKVTRPRSQVHNAFFHVFIQEVFDKWPRSHDFQPDEWKHLRAWLLCKAGHCEKMTVVISEDERHIINPIIKAFRTFFGTDKDRYTFVGIKGSALIAMRPSSLKYEDVDQHWFQPIAEKVFEIIEEETGMKADEHHKRWQEMDARRRAGSAHEEANS